MADIFISYARQDLDWVSKLAAHLAAAGWSVWWDSKIPAGRTFRQVIDEALEAARCVVVVWSEKALASDWVLEEADEGRKRRILVPVLKERVRPPLGFRQVQAADLTNWQGDENDQQYQSLVGDINALIGPPAKSLAGSPVARSQLPDPKLSPFGESVDPKTGIAFITIPAGEFDMGSETGESDERPVHRVRITQPFRLGKYPVTNAEYERFLKAHPQMSPPRYWTNSQFNDPRQPVVGVSWHDAQAFCQWAGCRLPTEAEWEYACRAGSKGRFCFGDDETRLGEYAWYDANSSARTHPVGQKKPNQWGLYDAHGNVWEWCQDWHGPYSEQHVSDPTGPKQGDYRVLHGGSWNRNATNLRSAFRGQTNPDYRDDYVGFRCVWLGDSSP
jgi:formylglycine-generating enzyme required for sulfatase activity